MDPVTLATIALTLVATKATEKMGEKLGEGVLAEARRLLALLQHKAPDTVKRLEAATDPTVIDAEVVEAVKQVAAGHPDVQTAIEATASAMEQKWGGAINQTQLAEKIGILIQGGYNSIQIGELKI